MIYDFQKFEGKDVRLENRITITKSNSIGFPSFFYTKNKINSFKYVVLYWDKKNKAIGIYFNNNEQEKNKFTIIHSKSGYGGSVVSRSFFKSYNLNPKKYYGRYQWKKIKLENVGTVFVIELKKQEQK